jgi:phosphoglycolate phosphatase-like HAD superfamily hydrolase
MVADCQSSSRDSRRRWLSGFQLVFWDIDGTLMHCGADGTLALNRTFSSLYGIENAFTKAGIGHAMDATVLNKIIEINQIDPEDLPKIRGHFLDNLKSILENNPEKRILPGVIRLLDFFESEGIRNGLLTSNLKAGAEVKLRSVNLLTRADGSPRFFGGGFGDEAGEKWDAAAKALADAASAFGHKISPEKVLVIGDGTYDIRAARHCGFQVIAVATGWMDFRELEAAAPDLLVRDLTELL